MKSLSEEPINMLIDTRLVGPLNSWIIWLCLGFAALWFVDKTKEPSVAKRGCTNT